MSEKEKIEAFLNGVSYRNRNFFKTLIDACNIEEMIKMETFEKIKLDVILMDGVLNPNSIETTASILLKLLKIYVIPKIINLGNLTYLLTKDGWKRYYNIHSSNWDDFMDLVLGGCKLNIAKKNLILKKFLDLIEKTNSFDDVIQLNNGYMENGKFKKGYYSDALPKINIDRDFTENTSCPTIDDLLLHLANYDIETKEWLLNNIASALILNSDYKLKNGQLIRLYGSGENGKSTFNKMLKKVFGSDNIFSTKIDSLTSSHKYDLKYVVNSLIAVDEDANESFYSASASSLLKILVTGESLSVREIYGKPIQTIPTCTIIVASNHPFKSDDKTDGVHRRISEIKTGSKLIRSGEWFNKLYSEEECQAFFNLCVKRANDLIEDFYKNGNMMKISKVMTERKKDLAKDNNNVLEFIEYNMEFIEGFLVTEVRQKYESWCEDNGLNPLGKTKFNETIENKLGLYRKCIKGNSLKMDSIGYEKSLLDNRYTAYAWIKE